jgi:predicted Zn finger-like uncharacterized protein
MIIECPVCPKPAPRYKIDASLIGEAGREVRCPRCGHQWFVTPEDITQQPPPPPQESLQEDDLQSDPSAEAGFHPNAQQIVGVTFEAAPPYGEPHDEDEPEAAVPSARPFAPQPVSAGAALAMAGSAASKDEAGPGASDDLAGEPHVPVTAAEIASAFFASSFEEKEEEEEERAEQPGEPPASFSSWAALDGVRPDEDDAPQPDELPAEESGAGLEAEAGPALHASPPQPLEDPGYEPPAIFEGANDYAEPPGPEPEESASRSEEYWARTFHGGDGAEVDEAAYGAADGPAAGTGGRDEELEAALASAANWSNAAGPSETAPASPAPETITGWSPPAETEDLTDAEAEDFARLVQALKGQEAGPVAGYGESAEENHAANPWPAENGRDEDFRQTSGWRSMGSPSAAGDDLPAMGGDYRTVERDVTPFLRSRPAPHEHEEPRSEPSHAYGAPLDYRHDPDEPESEAFPEEFDEALMAAEPRRMGGLAVAAAWGVFITIAAGLAGAAIHFRENVAQRLPGTARLYQALNVPVAPPRNSKLDLANVRYRWALSDNQPMIALEGDIISRSNTVERVPALVLALHDGDQSLPQKRIENVQVERIEANGTAHFSIDLAHPPKGINKISIEFVD